MMSVHSSASTSSPSAYSLKALVSQYPYGSYNPESSAAAFNRKRGSNSVFSGEDVTHPAKRKNGSNASLDDDDSEQTPEVKEYMDTQMLQIARQSRDAYNAKIRYQRLRMRELEMMRSFAEDELTASQVSLRQVERQIGYIRKRMYARGGIASVDQCRMYARGGIASVDQCRMQWSGLFGSSSCAVSACDKSETESSSESSDLECSDNYHDSILPPSS